jgi:hypothetical protein
MSGRSVVEVLSLPVRLNGIHLGRPVDALVHADDDRVVGFDVLCGDGQRRFLPFAVARIESSEIAVDSALPLIDDADAEYYRRRTRRLRELGLRDPRLDDGGVIREG